MAGHESHYVFAIANRISIDGIAQTLPIQIWKIFFLVCEAVFPPANEPVIFISVFWPCGQSKCFPDFVERKCSCSSFTN